MNKEEAQNWLRTFGDTPDELREPCQRGHKECSITRGGECLDDVLDKAIIVVHEVVDDVTLLRMREAGF